MKKILMFLLFFPVLIYSQVKISDLTRITGPSDTTRFVVVYDSSYTKVSRQWWWRDMVSTIKDSLYPQIEEDSLWVYSTTSTKPVLYLENDNDNSYAAAIYFLKDTDSPLAADNIGNFLFFSKNDAAEDVAYSQWNIQTDNIVDGSEDGKVEMFVMINGSLRSFIEMEQTGGADEGRLNINTDREDINVWINSAGAYGLHVEGSTGYVCVNTSASHLGTDPFSVNGSAFIKSLLTVDAGIDLDDSLKVSDDDFIGLGTGKGRIVFDDQSTDTLKVEDAVFDVDGVLMGDTYGSDGTVSDAELLYINSLTSNAQTQLDSKVNKADSTAGGGYSSYTALQDTASAIRTDMALGSHNHDATYLLLTAFGDSLANYDGDGIKVTDNDAIDVLVDVYGGLEIVDDSLNIKDASVTNAMLAGSIDLTSKVTGTLPEANGGTGDTDLDDIVGGDGLKATDGTNTIIAGDATLEVLVDYDGAIEIVDDSLNVKLDGATLTKSSSGLKVTDNTYQPLEATLTDIADGTIDENLVNTANPWADNEVADDITASNYLLLTAFGDSLANHNMDDSTWVNITSDSLIFADHIKANSADGLFLSEDGGTGIFIENGGQVGIGKLTPAVGLDIVSGNGEFRITDNETDDTNKQARLTVPHYDIDEEVVTIFQASILQYGNSLRFGGGSSINNAATEIKFYAGANNKTLTGTEQFRVTSSGLYAYNNVYIDGGNISLGDSTTGDVDAILYFADDASTTAESIKWDDGNDRFEISDDIYTAGTVAAGTVTGANVTSGADPGHTHTAYQAAHASLTSIAGLTETNGGIPYGTADNTYAWLAAGAEGTLLMGNGAGAPSFLGAGTSGYMLVAAGAADPVWTAPTGTGSPVKATSPTLVTPVLGTATATKLTVGGASADSTLNTVDFYASGNAKIDGTLEVGGLTYFNSINATDNAWIKADSDNDDVGQIDFYIYTLAAGTIDQNYLWTIGRSTTGVEQLYVKGRGKFVATGAGTKDALRLMNEQAAAVNNAVRLSGWLRESGEDSVEFGTIDIRAQSTALGAIDLYTKDAGGSSLVKFAELRQDTTTINPHYIKLNPAGSVEINGVRVWADTVTIADEGSVTVTGDGVTGDIGWGEVIVGDNEEYAHFRFTSAAVVTLTTNSANVVATDTNEKFCIIDAGTTVSLKNRLGSSKKIMVVVHYYDSD